LIAPLEADPDPTARVELTKTLGLNVIDVAPVLIVGVAVETEIVKELVEEKTALPLETVNACEIIFPTVSAPLLTFNGPVVTAPPKTTPVEVSCAQGTDPLGVDRIP
jgi:hypothetical protein